MKTRIRQFAIPGFALSFLLLAGCLSSATSSIRIDDGTITSNNPAFASHFKAHRDVSVVTPEGFRRVQVRLENLERANRQLQYRFQWIDENGMVLSTAKPLWNVLTLHGRDIVELEAICPLQGAADFRLDLRPL
ncbi:MAG: YcfL family protein [Kiritimatiellae bacterium]|nr:YcfL family protein [Kiritimatiellia bacterium]